MSTQPLSYQLMYQHTYPHTFSYTLSTHLNTFEQPLNHLYLSGPVFVAHHCRSCPKALRSSQKPTSTLTTPPKIRKTIPVRICMSWGSMGWPSHQVLLLVWRINWPLGDRWITIPKVWPPHSPPALPTHLLLSKQPWPKPPSLILPFPKQKANHSKFPYVSPYHILMHRPPLVVPLLPVGPLDLSPVTNWTAKGLRYPSTRLQDPIQLPTIIWWTNTVILVAQLHNQYVRYLP